MGLFDKRDKTSKKKDDFDSPVEQIDLSAPPAAAPKAEPAPAATAAAAPAPAAPAEPPPKPAVRARAPEPDPYGPSYGIDRAIELMRSLPNDNIELVVQVVKHTLESTQIRIPEIIDDARRKQDDIQGRIKVLRSEISEFEREIDTRKEEISRLDADYKETSMVRERLELAENLGKKTEPKKPESASSASSASSTSGTLGQRKPAAAVTPRSGSAASGSTGSTSASSKPAARVSKTTVVAKK